MIKGAQRFQYRRRPLVAVEYSRMLVSVQESVLHFKAGCACIAFAFSRSSFAEASFFRDLRLRGRLC